MSEYDHVALTDAIVRRLSELYVEEKHRAHINAHSGNRASPAAAFLATDANIPKLNKDPIKNAKPSCAICGKTGHIEDQCFHNELASCPMAISRAPVGTPLYRKHHPISAGSQPPPPRHGSRHKAAKPSSASAARALATSSSRPSEHEVEQALADTLGRCGLLADDNNGRVLMALATSPPTRHAAHTHTIAVSDSSPLMRNSSPPSQCSRQRCQPASLRSPSTVRRMGLRRLADRCHLPCCRLRSLATHSPRPPHSMNGFKAAYDHSPASAISSSMTTSRAQRLILNTHHHPRHARTHSPPLPPTPPVSKG